MAELLRSDRQQVDRLESVASKATAARFGLMWRRCRPGRAAVAALAQAAPKGMTGREVAESRAYEALDAQVRAEMALFVEWMADAVVQNVQEAVRAGQRTALAKVLASVDPAEHERVLGLLDVPEWLAAEWLGQETGQSEKSKISG
jgi:murein L,D-transpeptidase YcbB/YkuD